MTRRGERGDPAATVLGVCDPRRTGFCRAHGLHAFQTGQAWPFRARGGLAALVVPPGREWPLSRRVDRRQRRAASERRAAAKSETGEHRAKPWRRRYALRCSALRLL